MKTLIVINGRAGVGKDTFVKFCKGYMKDLYGVSVYNIHRSDLPKLALASLGWDGKKTVSVRTMLKSLVDFMEEEGLMDTYIEDYVERVEEGSIIFLHVRETSKIQKLTEKYKDTNVIVTSLLLQREIEQQEPDNWFSVTEGNYDIKIDLPQNNLIESRKIAEAYIHFIRTSVKEKI